MARLKDAKFRFALKIGHNCHSCSDSLFRGCGNPPPPSGGWPIDAKMGQSRKCDTRQFEERAGGESRGPTYYLRCPTHPPTHHTTTDIQCLPHCAHHTTPTRCYVCAALRTPPAAIIDCTNKTNWCPRSPRAAAISSRVPRVSGVWRRNNIGAVMKVIRNDRSQWEYRNCSVAPRRTMRLWNECCAFTISLYCRVKFSPSKS